MSTPLSVIVPTRRGWPGVEATIGALAGQAAAVGAEILVLDASGNGEPGGLASHIRWISRPTNESVFELRATGYREAVGEVVAVTEDHCRVTPGWCARVLALHEAHPEAVAIGGAVANGTPGRVIDEAAFLVTQIPFVAPLPNGPVARTTGPLNLSMKRRATSRLPDHRGFGTIELLDAPLLVLDGEILIQTDELLVLHDQSLGFAETTKLEFHNGRTIGGFRRRQMARDDWLRVAGVAVLPAYRSARTIGMALRKRVPRMAVMTAIPAIFWLQYVAGAGEFIGYLSGPGESPRHLR